MNIRSSLFGALSVAALLTHADAFSRNVEQKPSLLWEVTEGLEKPESAYYDHKTHSIFVSNIAGDPSDKDGRGWISRLNVDGKVVNPQWFSGLNAPKGLRSYGDTLWVADIDRLIGISIKQAKIVHEFIIPNAKFLNDVEVDSRGNVYVSDFLDNRIYRAQRDGVSFQNPEVFLEGEDLQNPNGLLFVRDQLIIGRWGLNIQADFSTEIPGSLVLKQKSKSSVKRVTADFANIDGVEYLGFGKFLVSDYIQGVVYRVDHHGNPEIVVVDKPGAADIGWIPFRRILLIPNSNDSIVKAYQL